MVAACAVAEGPRYVFFNLAPGANWSQDRPESITPALFREVVDRIDAPENPELRVGVSLVFSVLNSPPERLLAGVDAALTASRSSGVPILIAFDGQNWWENRPDLWNWWDPTKPGYDPKNVENVEWTGPKPESAVKIGWRNWGGQIRVAPAQNLLSPRVLAETKAAMRPLLERVKVWEISLGESEKVLYGGLKIGWETGLGYNAFYYPRGNFYHETWPDDPSHDPTTGIDLERGLFGGTVPLGYGAMVSGGISTADGVTRDRLGEVVSRYLGELVRFATTLGIKQDTIFTHQGGTYETRLKHMPYWPALHANAIPGWSFYGCAPTIPSELDETMEERGQNSWCAAEWWWGAQEKSGWLEHFQKTFSYRDCRFVCVYNWDHGGFKDQPGAIEAVRELVATWEKE